jgi:hypothetical protein
MAPTAPPLVRTFVPPLSIALAVVTAGALLLLAAAIAPPPLSDAIASPPTAPASVEPPDGIEVATLARTAHAALPAAPAVVDLARLIYAPRSGGSSRALSGPLLLVVESGLLTVHAEAGAQLLRADQPPVEKKELLLRPGDGMLLPAATGAAFRNDESVPAVAIAAGVFPATAAQSKLGRRAGPASWPADWSPGATVQALAGGWLVDTSSGPAALALQRLTLPARTSMPLTEPGPVDLAVETGALTLDVSGGLVWLQHPDGPDAMIAPGSGATLLPSDAALFQDEAGITIRNDGSCPLLALLLTVAPAASPPAPSTTP